MPRSTTHVIFSLLLISLCSCKDMRWRKLPEEKDITFEGTAKKPQKTAYRPGQARDIQLNLSSSDSEAKEAKFKVVSWSEAGGKQGTLDTASISLGENTLHYTPQEPGTHELTLKVAVEGEEASAKTFHYTLEAPAAEWQARGRADDAGNLTLTIADAPEAWHSEPWRIINSTFSEGLQGRIEPMPTRLNHGENHLNIILDQVVLQEEEPHVHFTLQGPDGSPRDHQVDLTAFCVARLRSDMSEVDGRLADGLREVNDQHEPETERLYPLLPETVTDPRVNREKQRELTHRLNLMERDLEGYDRDLQRLEALEVQDPEHPNRQLPTFRRGKQRLQDAIASLKSAQVQLQQQCTTAHEALFKTLRNEEQEAIDILLEDPRLDVNEIDEEGNTPLHFAVGYNNKPVVEKMIEIGANVNANDNRYDQTPLHVACAVQDAEEIVELLLENRANVNYLDKEGSLALHLAATNGSLRIVELLIENRANVNYLDKKGNLALHHCANWGHTEVMTILLDQSINKINKQNKYGQTPLHKAVQREEYNAVSLLLDRGASKSITDKASKTPLQRALEMYNESQRSDNMNRIIEILQD